MWSHAKWALCYFRFLVGRNRRRESTHRRAPERRTYARDGFETHHQGAPGACARRAPRRSPRSRPRRTLRWFSGESARRAKRTRWRGVPRFEPRRVWRRLGNASRTSPRPSPPGQNRANRLTTTIRVFSTRNRISKRIPRRPAAPGRGRTMTFSTGTPPSSDLRTRLTRVAFSSWPFTCVSPPAQLRHARHESEPERARARARNPGARSARTSASTSPRRGSSGSPEAFFASDLALKKRRQRAGTGARSTLACVFSSFRAKRSERERARPRP